MCAKHKDELVEYQLRKVNRTVYVGKHGPCPLENDIVSDASCAEQGVDALQAALIGVCIECRSWNVNMDGVEAASAEAYWVRLQVEDFYAAQVPVRDSMKTSINPGSPTVYKPRLM